MCKYNICIHIMYLCGNAGKLSPHLSQKDVYMLLQSFLKLRSVNTAAQLCVKAPQAKALTYVRVTITTESRRDSKEVILL